MEAYPIMLSIKGKEAVVVGGGTIAYRKMIGLLQAGALVTVVSPELHEKVEQLYLEARIEWKKKEFEPTDIASAWLVIAATNSHVVNELVALSAQNHQLLNIVDNPEASNFHVPAKLTRGDLTISVATAGASPTLAKTIRDELSLIYDDSYKDYLQFLAEVREKIRHSTLEHTTKMHYIKESTEDTFRQSKEKQQDFIEKIDRLLYENAIHV
ncbi:NAD(P)-binding protein [Sporosarcina sp. ACRSM]|uniref:NAD(P)-binding protein n=1 Tax=Sporosarcina sp. ACRSM TaxID=2918216 RepID=UPI001EF54FC9|nr:NAD(P)-binding protein [Sporosarcina sp. ACRSM]MCG7334546.1 NAD(P)-binding protein [Sporosarcina sp. ACRSM]